ncbi:MULTISPECIES: porin [unclassified Bradyrhizobium]|uniref:porin n=1 Tax=unclassified Bradyrhizobium TaxID=2631580 RepID=UPI0029166175|nr:MULTISPECIES: porin [unclassified Bradyrhizobium]
MCRSLILGALAVLAAVTVAAAGSPGSLLLAPSLPGPKAAGPNKAASRSGAATSNPCASYGANFVRVEGTDTCVKVGGALRVEMGTSTSR